MSKHLHDLPVTATNISDQLKFNKIFKEYLFHKMRYDRGLYGTAVTPEDLAGIRITCRLLWSDLKSLDPVRTLREVPPLKVTA